VINFHPPKCDDAETGAHLDVRHLLRPTLPHPDLTPLIEVGARNGLSLELRRDREGIDILTAASKSSPELAVAMETWKEIRFEFDTADKLDTADSDWVVCQQNGGAG
jgi:hypothetical protein